MKTLLKKHKFILSLVALCALFLFPLFDNKLPLTHDGESHIARFGAYEKAITDGQIPPRWAGELNYSYGSPLFIFLYPLPGYIAIAIRSFDISLETTFKIIAGLSFILAPVCFYLWTSRFLSKSSAFFASLFYGLAPYHFLDLYVRGDVGELVAFVFIPLVFFGIYTVTKKWTSYGFFLGSISYGLVILSHNIFSLIFTPIFIAYVLMQSKGSLKGFMRGILVLAFGLAITSYFWLPALYESRYLNTKLFVGDMYKEHFPRFSQILFSPVGFGPNVRERGGLSPQLGIFHIGIVIVMSLLLIIKKQVKKDHIFWIGVFAIGVFLSLSLSDIFWRYVPFLKQFQFPWRFVGLASFAAAVIAGLCIERFNKKILFFIGGGLFFSSFYFIQIHSYVSKPDSYYLQLPATTFHHGEATTIWTAGDANSFPKKKVEVVSGIAQISSIQKKSDEHIFLITAETDSHIVDNTVYFPGWQVFVDNKKTNIEFQDMNHRGLITFLVPQGKHVIEVIFKESPIRFIADLISVISVIICLVLLFIGKRIVKLSS